ncbi:unnamed protein product [Caenorhabditis nigoni]
MTCRDATWILDAGSWRRSTCWLHNSLPGVVVAFVDSIDFDGQHRMEDVFLKESPSKNVKNSHKYVRFKNPNDTGEEISSRRRDVKTL